MENSMFTSRSGGATPKDGPSAGVALVVALASLLTKTSRAFQVAMTGEIQPARARVARRWLKEKVLAASRLALRKLFCRKETNPTGWKLRRKSVPKLKAHFVRQISEPSNWRWK